MSDLKDADADETSHPPRAGLATEFGKALEADAHPVIEEYLQQAPPSQRDTCLPELISEEYASRWNKGQLPTLEAYQSRFPNDRDLVKHAILTLAGGVRYPLLKELGSGGMGTVFLAKDTELDRHVAFKVIKPGCLTAKAISRFQQELSIATMELPGIVRVYDTGEFRNGQRYIVMQYIAGKTLRHVIDEAPSPPDLGTIMRAAQIMIQIAQAVHRAHRKGTKHHPVVHRDLKPENILIDEDGNPYVADFGLAATVADLHAAKCAVGGTVHYMSPEQVRECQDRGRGVDTRSDIWSLGAILFEMVTGTWPFLGTSREAIMEAIERDHKAPKDLNTNVPLPLDGIIRKCLKKDPDERSQTAQELAEDLEDWLNAVTGPAEGYFVPYLPSRFLTGREQEIAKCRASLECNGRVAFFGLGGMGKTQTALAYAHEYGKKQKKYRFVFWANADSSAELARDFAQLASELKLPQKPERDQSKAIDAVKRWFETHDQWLLVLDNANDLSVVQPFLPQTAQGHILLTTQCPWAGGFAAPLEILPLNPEEGALLLLRRAGLLPSDGRANVAVKAGKAATAISTELYGLPLALDQAGAYIDANEITPAEYLDRYRTRSNRVQLLADQTGQGFRNNYEKTVATTWLLALQTVEEESQAAADLLRVCSFMAPDAIPGEVIKEAGRLVEGALSEATENQLQLDKAIQIARKFSLLRRDTRTNTLSMHGLVQCVQQSLMDTASARAWFERAAIAVYSCFPRVWPGFPHKSPKAERLLPHARRVLDWWKSHEKAVDGIPAALLLARVGAYCQSRPFIPVTADALPRLQLQKAFVILGHAWNTLSDSGDLERRAELVDPFVQNMLDLASALLPQSRDASDDNDEYLRLLYENAAIVAEWIGGENDARYLTVRLSIAYWRMTRGAYAEAETICCDVLDQVEAENTVLHALGTCMLLVCEDMLKGEKDTFDGLFPSYLRFPRDYVTKDSRCYAAFLASVAVVKFQRGNAEAAELLRLRALQIRRMAVGEQHQDLALWLLLTAADYAGLGGLAQAQQCLEEAIRITQSNLGTIHQFSHLCVECFVWVCGKRGDYGAAQSLLDQWLGSICQSGLLSAEIADKLKLAWLELIAENQSPSPFAPFNRSRRELKLANIDYAEMSLGLGFALFRMLFRNGKVSPSNRVSAEIADRLRPARTFSDSLWEPWDSRDQSSSDGKVSLDDGG